MFNLPTISTYVNHVLSVSDRHRAFLAAVALVSAATYYENILLVVFRRMIPIVRRGNEYLISELNNTSRFFVLGV